ncbi:DUF421 domain-containing protein [Natribacillus halophilus]|uniref:Uncharacterized membrane protein YcaP, DUF421 family n=1 Tax=Natribacillus halophilus TaxID=549003 RepID=A0A1G8QNR7_9BACI|nr:DUF421 domain-containing protein [Natribacillus halophilus]SDJ06271.1 Uncharacterized membrane protein YcaP, DUF421 family [Natribacillus halophilus]
METAWQSIVMVISGVLLLRIAGRKSISQMTMAQTVVMISIGSIIIEPIVETSVWEAIIGAGIFIIALITMEYVQIKFNFLEKLITGKSKVVIENGVPHTENLKKLRYTVDQLEIQLRQQGITSFSDVQKATLEPNGQLGYELVPDARPLTVKDFKQLLQIEQNQDANQQEAHNIFDELSEKDKKDPDSVTFK